MLLIFLGRTRCRNQTQHFGKNLRAAPDAKIDDGLLDFFAMKANVVNRGEQLAILNQLPKGAHVSHPGIMHRQVKGVSIHIPNGPGLFNVDGEICRHDGVLKLVTHRRMVPVLASRASKAVSL